jgi:hypothetical protein
MPCRAKEIKNMSSKSTTALAVAIVLSTASNALSAPKHRTHPTPQRHQAAKRQVPPVAYGSFEAPVRRYVPRESGYMGYQDMGINDSLGD